MFGVTADMASKERKPATDNDRERIWAVRSLCSLPLLCSTPSAVLPTALGARADNAHDVRPQEIMQFFNPESDGLYGAGLFDSNKVVIFDKTVLGERRLSNFRAALVVSPRFCMVF